MCQRYKEYANGFLLAQKSLPTRVLAVKYREFCISPKQNIERICEFIDLDFDLHMLKFKLEYEVYGTCVDTKYIDEYKQGLTLLEIGQIEREIGSLFKGY